MQTQTLSILLLCGMLLVVAAIISLLVNLHKVIVMEYERGLLYHGGRFKRLLGPGMHWYNGMFQSLTKVDLRQRTVTLPGQEILSADNVGIRISLTATLQVIEPEKAIHGAINYHEEIYLLLQTTLRDQVGTLPVEELLSKRRQIGELVLQTSQPAAAALGVALLAVSIKDIMFPGELRNIFAQVVNARHEGLAALERARGETAALRNLANAAHLLENTPGLYTLRLLQTLSSQPGNTILLNTTGDETLQEWLKKRAAGKKAGKAEHPHD